MTTMQCNSCGGTYSPIGDDGVPYAHACPPVTRVAVTRGGKALRVDLVDVQPTDVIKVLRDEKVIDVAVADAAADDVRQGDVAVARANKRDENPVTVIVNGKPVSKPRAEGAGVSAVAVVAD